MSETEYDFSTGFCVPGSGTAEFLEDALGKLGLNRTEANEFIVYWLPLMQENAEKTGGSLRITSEEGKGTELTVTLDTRSIDCLPLGDLPGTLLSLILMHPDTPDFHFHGVSPAGVCDVNTREIRQAAGGLPLNEPVIAAWLRSALKDEIHPIFGGV